MKNLKNYSDSDIVRLIEEHWITEDDFYESGICPVCFNQEHDNVLYGEDLLLYEDDDLICYLVQKPRAEGHVVIYSKKHYSDLGEVDSEICQRIFLFIKEMTKYLKDAYQAESIYMCSITDGDISHFQVQLIPRYHYEKIGSSNFIKYRKPYVEGVEQEKKLRLMLSKIRGDID